MRNLPLDNNGRNYRKVMPICNTMNNGQCIEIVFHINDGLQHVGAIHKLCILDAVFISYFVW